MNVLYALQYSTKVKSTTKLGAWNLVSSLSTVTYKIYCLFSYCKILHKESRAAVRKPRDAAAVLFSLKFADNIHYKFKSSQASKARLQIELQI